jgi:DNA-directed RNA polymerase specialized sigma24 family protein
VKPHDAKLPDEDDRLVWQLAHGDGRALEPLMERWGDPVAETCFRALRDARRSYDLYAEVWAEAYQRIRFGAGGLPDGFGPWIVEVIGDLLANAAGSGRIPVTARARMKLATVPLTPDELAQLERLRDSLAQHDARAALPRDFSAAADRMLLNMPTPEALAGIELSSYRGVP